MSLTLSFLFGYNEIVSTLTKAYADDLSHKNTNNKTCCSLQYGTASAQHMKLISLISFPKKVNFPRP